MRALAVLVLVGLVAAAPGRATTLEEAQAEAAATERLVLVDASSESCGPCRRFLAARKSSTRLQSGLARHAFVVVGDETPAGQRTQARLHVSSVPTFLLLTAKGEEIERWAGFTTVDAFLGRLADAAADPTTLEAKRARFDARPTSDLARRIASTLTARSEDVDALRYYDRAAALEPSLVRPMASDRYFAVRAAVSRGDLTFEDLMDAGERYVAAFQGTTTEARYVARNVAQGLAEAVPEGLDRARIKPAIERALATYTGRLSGDDSAQRDRLSAARQPPRTLDQRLADLDAKPSVDGTFAILSDLMSAGRHADAARIARRTVDLDTIHAAQLAQFALSIVADGVCEGQVSVADLDAAGRHAVEAGGGTDEARLASIEEVARALAAGQDAELLRTEVEAGLALTEDTHDEAHASARAELLALQAAVLEKDGSKALALERQSLGEGWEQDPAQVLDMAEFLLDCGIELPEAERLAREALAAAGNRDARERDVRIRSALAVGRALRAQGRADEATAVLETTAKASPHEARLARALATR